MFIDKTKYRKSSDGYMRKDTQIFPKFEEEYIGNNTFSSGNYGRKREATKGELGGIVRKTTDQLDLKSNSGVHVKSNKKLKPRVI